MSKTVVIACVDIHNPPATLQAFAGMDIVVQRIAGLGQDVAGIYREADALITEMQPVPAAIMAAMPRCRIIACVSTGYDYVHLEAATQRGIWVTNCAGYCTDEVATHTIALLLSQARRLPQVRALARNGEWDPRPVRPLQHVQGQTLGLIGWGRIGKAVAAKAKALGFTVLANDPYVEAGHMHAAGVRAVDLATLLREADYVSLHAPLDAKSRAMIDAGSLALMKPTAYLINTARGAIVDEAALLRAVTSGQIVGAALDVLETEPPGLAHAFLHDERFFVTPHSAWCSEQADAMVWEWAASYVASVLRGKRPGGAVNDVG